ncbi:MAG: hypothetical protein CMB86_00025 [Flammeovirgaceae bacterium]|nr:hypothetical protein [Flammeovirgaceae bacterium]|tara:strand:- start:419 stop:859 length:441 start_codon:yes stop_codon:yes gene_type:complete
MSLRKAGIDDINSIVKIEKISHEKPYWNESLLIYLFNNSMTDSVWIFEFKKKIIGFLIEQRCLNEISILNVAVDKKYQNKGFGKKMVSQYLNILPNNTVVFLEVNINNFVAQKIYTSLNFERVGLRKRYYNNGADALLMRFTKNSF